MRSSTTRERDAPSLAPLPRARDRAPFADAFAAAAGRLPPVGAAGFVAAFDVAAGVPFGFAVPTFAVAAFTGTFGEVAAFVTVALAALAGADLPPAGLLVPAGFF